MATKAPHRKVLKKCAGMLYAKIRSGESASAQRRLHGGLILTLQRRGSAYFVLSLTRKDVYPSVTEQDLCVEAFDIPYTAIISRDVQPPYHIIRFQWAQGRGNLTRWISQAHLEPGVGLHQWREIVIEKHGIHEASDFNHLSLDQLKHIKTEIMEVSEQWLQTTSPSPKRAPNGPPSG